MTNHKLKRKTVGVLAFLMASTLILTACGDKEPEKTEMEIQYEQNVAQSPERSKEVMDLIEMSRGTLVVDTFGEPVKGEDGEPTGEVEGTFSEGIQKEFGLSVFAKEDLAKLEKTEQIDIYINGIIRDEFHIAANVLYGEEAVVAQKAAFKEALLSPMEEGEGRIVDVIGIESSMRDANVANHHVDDIIKHLNRFYILPEIGEDFDTRLVIKGTTYPVNLKNGLNSLATNAREFVKLESESDWELTDKDKETLNIYYREGFKSALESSTFGNHAYTETLGGFELKEDGLWYPSDMNRFADSLIRLAYFD